MQIVQYECLTLRCSRCSPRIVKYQKDNELFVLMDCGAWLEKYRVGPDPNTKSGETFHSQQIGVVIGNDLRIYHYKQYSLPWVTC